MNLKPKDFIKLGALSFTASVLPGLSSCSATDSSKQNKSSLSSLTADTKPIYKAERESRIEKAQQLLAKNNMAALVLDCGTSLEYFAGVSWWPTERIMVAIIPEQGSVKYICPAFEEDRLREQITIGNEVYVWQEDESPYRLIVNILKDAGIQPAPLEWRNGFGILSWMAFKKKHRN